MESQKIIIMGAAGRDFHNFNTVYRGNPKYEVVAFTATQIPFIEGRTYPGELAGSNYPSGIPIFSEKALEMLIKKHRVDQVVFAYSDVSHEYVMHRASLCLSLGADFVLLGPEKTMFHSRRPVISVCAVRTGCGKTGITRYIVRILKDKGVKPVVIRHPMPYHDLVLSRSQRFEKMEDLEAYNCTIEEREEIEPLLNAGIIVYSGVDYGEILKRAEEEAEIIIWDGGNNDLPFIRSDLEIVVLDPHRYGHEVSYHPGETNLRRADIAVINKVDTGSQAEIEKVEENIKSLSPGAKIVHTASPIIVDDPERIRGKKVLVVEDGPTLTHGGMSYGAGVIAARRFGAGEILDPRPYAKGSIEETFRQYPHINNLLPATGYSAEQIGELKDTIEKTPCDLILIATPIDLSRFLDLKKETMQVRYEIKEVEGMRLKGYIEEFVSGTKL